jgi:peptide/nickel transport system permease protein
MGSVIVERVYSLPGIGQMIIQDVGNRDITEVQGTLIVLTSVIMFLTMGLNLLSALIDPRMKVRR